MTIDEAIQKARSNENSFKNNHKLNLTLKERSPYYGLDCLRIADDNKHLAEWLEELKEYQQLEEQSRLIKLPCKDVYSIVDINNPRYAAVTKRPIRELAIYEIESIDKENCKYFSTEEKAEAKLKELRGGKNGK